jgi:tRNA dimethylallyltransferase
MISKEILTKQITEFLSHATYPLLVILGPTGCGKTALSLSLAQQFHGEVINADSRQIYKGMDIGTNKITLPEMKGIPHHLFSFKNPDEVYTVAEYKRDAVEAISDIHARKHIPFLVGGTGLYINSVALNYDIPRVEPDWDLRKGLEEQSSAQLHEQLMQSDPDEAKKIHPHQKRYLIRALEIALTGKKKSEIAKKDQPVYDCFFIGIDVERKVLYKRLEDRVDQMVKNGLLEEVKKLLQAGYNEQSHAMNGIGYKEILAYLEGHIALDEAVDLIKKNTRHFAKRQMTWFRRIPDVHWVML